MITHGGESVSLSFEPDVDVFTIFGVFDIRPTHFGHEALNFFSTTGKERSAERETKCQCRQGKDFSDHDGFCVGVINEYRRLYLKYGYWLLRVGTLSKTGPLLVLKTRQ